MIKKKPPRATKLLTDDVAIDKNKTTKPAAGNRHGFCCHRTHSLTQI